MTERRTNRAKVEKCAGTRGTSEQYRDTKLKQNRNGEEEEGEQNKVKEELQSE